MLAKGLEPDECYWVRNTPMVWDKEEIDLDVDPPPDLAIEVENTKSVVNKMAIYASLGFPEVWRFNGRTLRVARLQLDGSYRWGKRSAAFPFLKLNDLVRFLELAVGTQETPWIRLFTAWVREELAPRFRVADDAGPIA